MTGDIKAATRPISFDHRLIFLAAGMFAIGTDNFVIAGLLVEIAQDFNVSIAAAGQLITVYAFCYAVFTPVVAVATANWPRERVLLGGLIVFVLGNLIAAYSASFVQIMAGRGISGLGAALFAPTASATAAAFVGPGKRGGALAAMMTALSLATVLGAPIGTLVGTLFGWRLTFFGVAGLAAPVAVGIAIFVRCDVAALWLSLRERMAPMRNRGILLTLCSTFLVLCGLYITYIYMGVVFDRATGGDGIILALLMAILGFAGTVGTIVSGRLTDKLGGRVVVNATLLLLIADFALLPWASAHLSSSVAALMVWGFCGWAFVIPQQHRLIELAPQFAPIALGLHAMAVYGSTSAAGAIGALAYTIVGFYQLPLIGAALGLCGLIVSEYLCRSRYAR
jgi:predicted MFS family arabinose efflux permease